MDKMEAVGTPLKEWDVEISRGVITGYNKAFIIDDVTRQELVVADPNSAEIIKPVLRGKDIRRYRTQGAGLWLIVAKFGSYKTLPKEYPAIYEHLAQHEEKLRARGQCKYSRAGNNNPNVNYDGQHHWLELDNNPTDEYLDIFAGEKLFWMDMAPEGRFAYSATEIYCNNTGFIMMSKFLKYLCAVLNSTLITWLIQNIARTTGVGLIRWEKFIIERLPVPRISTVKQRPFIRLVDRILRAKDADPEADTAKQEAEIDRLVYGLYGLTAYEVAAVRESFSRKAHESAIES